MFAILLIQLYKLDGITGTGIAVAAKTAKGVGFGVNLQAEGLIGMEGAFYEVAFIGPKAVMG